MKLKRTLPDDVLALLPDAVRDKEAARGQVGTRARDRAAESAPDEADEAVRYAMPFDLTRTGRIVKDAWLVVTNATVYVIRDGEVLSLPIRELRSFELENTDDGGYLFAVAKAETSAAERLGSAEKPTWLLRFSKRYIVQMAYIARGVQLLIDGRRDVTVVSVEKERYCETCGRALPGTSVCPHCDGAHQTFRRIMSLSKDYRKQLMIIMLPVLFITFTAIGQRSIERYYIDHVLRSGEGTGRDLLIYFLIMLTIGVLSIGAFVFRQLWTNRLGTRISRDLRQKVYYKLNALQLSFVDRYEAGELMQRVVWDTDHIRRFIEMVFGEMLSLIVTIVAIAVTMFVINWKMALLALVMYPVAMVIVRGFRKKERRLWRQQWRFRDRVNSRLQDVISGIRVVKSFGQEQREAERFQSESHRLRDLIRRNELFWATLYPFVTFLVMLGSLLVTGYGGYEVLGGRLTMGQLVQMIGFTGMMYGPLGFLTRLPRMLVRLNTSLDRIYDVLDEPIELEQGTIDMEGKLKGHITFDDVSFGYHTYEPVLRHITADIKPGEKIGLVGASGAGKSTLINLIMKLYTVDEGSITVDGVNIRDIAGTSYHRELGIVLQESFLFSGTIAQNIRYADPDADMEAVMEAARLANAHDFIVKFPDGYDTYVGESGGRLSGGEKQRIAISRAILHNPSMLILDEPTSSLDLETEVLIQEALERLTEGKTTFTIAHRLSTLKDSDRIMVIDNHEIAEFGSHEELMAQGGIYHGLVMAQLDMHKVSDEVSA